jgi:hypothetical protein
MGYSPTAPPGHQGYQSGKSDGVVPFPAVPSRPYRSMDQLRQTLEEIRDKAAELRDDFGDEARARALEWAAARLDAALDDFSNQQLTLAQAARESGYSPEHLGRFVRLGKIPNAGRPHAPRILRADVPQKPGALRPRPLTLMVDRRQIARSVVNSTTRDHDG